MRGISMDAVVKHGAQDKSSVGRKELMNAILLQKQIKNPVMQGSSSSEIS